MTGRNPFGGTLGDDGGPLDQHRGELCWSWPAQGKLIALRLLYPSICSGERLVYKVGATQRNVRLHALVGKKDGHTFAPNGRNVKLDIGCQDLSGLVLTR